MCGLRCYLYCASNALPKLKFNLGLATDFLLNEVIEKSTSVKEIYKSDNTISYS